MSRLNLVFGQVMLAVVGAGIFASFLASQQNEISVTKVLDEFPLDLMLRYFRNKAEA